MIAKTIVKILKKIIIMNILIEMIMLISKKLREFINIRIVFN